MKYFPTQLISKKTDKKISRKNPTTDKAKQQCPQDQQTVPKEPCSVTTLKIRQERPKKKSLIGETKKEDLSDKTVLFWNTYNSVDLSGYAAQHDYHELPEEFHKFFEVAEHSLDG